MELEFDKEMDAILRRARGGENVAVATPHLDADAVAAFVENALPGRVRRLYVEHFADCDRCRKLLSQSILMSETAASLAAVGAAEVITAPIAEGVIPWYQKLFRAPGLAIAMGGLVLTFSVVLGYLVLQNEQADSNASVAQITDQELQRGPSAPEAPAAANSNSSVAANAAAIDPSQTTNAALGMTAANTAAPSVSLDGTDTRTLALRGEAEAKDVATGAAAGAQPEPKVAEAAPPPPPVAADAIRAQPEAARERDDAGAEKQKEDKEEAKKRSAFGSFSSRRDVPAPAAKAGPSRAGPVQSANNQVQNQTFEMPVTRVVGGKTFENRDRAWYDRAYRNQPTTNVRRGTEEFRRLDSGLRSIANALDGVVVVVWKDKAYRIQ